MGGASNEWQYLHLTEKGWSSGGHRYDNGENKDDMKPPGAVLTVFRHVTVGSIGAPSSMNVDERTTKHISDEGKIKALLDQFGDPPFCV